jgi:hypothetical protein
MSDQGVEVLPPIRVDETDEAIKELTDELEHYDRTDQGKKDSPSNRVDGTDEPTTGRIKQDTIQTHKPCKRHLGEGHRISDWNEC